VAITKTVLLDLCDSYFGSKERTEFWLKTPNLSLGKQTPESLIVTDTGIKRVYDCIQRLQHGMTS
jgi:putative toxin-antitoxin system antitoxin component (TIGR02293 family)